MCEKKCIQNFRVSVFRACLELFAPDSVTINHSSQVTAKECVTAAQSYSQMEKTRDPELPPMNSIPEHPSSPGQFTKIVSSKYTCQEQESFEVQQARWRTAVVHLDLPHDIKWWSAEHVADWLDHIGFRQHSDNFIKNGITGQKYYCCWLIRRC